jgi:LPXTG-motif cell wall-anchored protein
MPQGALVKLQAGKELTNKGVSANAGQFEFELRSIQYQAAKVGKVNGDGQIPENTFNITDVFPDATERDAVKAFQIIDHNTLNYNTNSFDLNSFKNAMQTALPGQDTGWISIAGLIDSCMIGSKPTNTQQIFYTAMTNSVIENAGISSVNGKYTDLANGHYMFVNDHVEATAKNDKDGKVSFPYLAFSEQDKGKTFTYSMSEVPDPDDPDVENYDNRVHTVTITIGEDMSVAVKYDGGDNAPVFRNTLKEYTLPNTGGPGIVPYITFGAAMMTASVVLLLRKKRREVKLLP